ncbi:MAG: DNRLRE domain-containing protein [Pseudomonadota bacterium]
MRSLFLSIAFTISAALAASAAPILATDTYYTFGSNVSANSGTRLLGDKATTIGFPGLDTISFIQFDASDLPAAPLPSNQSWRLLLEHDPALAGTLIEATEDRPVSLSIYAVSGPWDPVSGNLAGIQYGTDGAAAIATTLVGAPGVYEWDVTSLINGFISNGLPTDETFFALSGLFGNTDTDGFNSYGTFYAEGATDGLAPQLRITLVPLPMPALLLLTGVLGLAAVKRRA